MILPNKVIKIEDSLIYKSLQYYKNSEQFEVKSKKDIEYLTILYAFGYLNCIIRQSMDDKGGVINEIKITKNK